MIDPQDVERLLKVASEVLLKPKCDFAGLDGYIAQGKEGGGQFFLVRVDDVCETPVHQHTYDEFCLVLKGHLVTRIGDREIVSGPGDFIYEPANIPHQGKIQGPYVALDFFAGPRFEVEE